MAELTHEQVASKLTPEEVAHLNSIAEAVDAKAVSVPQLFRAQAIVSKLGKADVTKLLSPRFGGGGTQGAGRPVEQRSNRDTLYEVAATLTAATEQRASALGIPADASLSNANWVPLTTEVDQVFKIWYIFLLATLADQTNSWPSPVSVAPPSTGTTTTPAPTAGTTAAPTAGSVTAGLSTSALNAVNSILSSL